MAGSETGLEMFARLAPRPSLRALEPALFPDGPGAREVLEVTGEPSSGKTLLLARLAARCALAREAGGCGARAALLDADRHFGAGAVYEAARACAEAAGATDPVAAAHDALDRLDVFPVRDGVQLRVTLHAVRALAASAPDLALVLLDGVAASYWQDSLAGGPRRIDRYVRELLALARRTLCDFGGVLVYSRPAYFRSEGPQGPAGPLRQGGPARRVALARLPACCFVADVEDEGPRRRLFFNVDSAGIRWTDLPPQPTDEDSTGDDV